MWLWPAVLGVWSWNNLEKAKAKKNLGEVFLLPLQLQSTKCLKLVEACTQRRLSVLHVMLMFKLQYIPNDDIFVGYFPKLKSSEKF